MLLHEPQVSVKKQKGIALLFVLLIFAVITTVSVKIITDVQRNTERQARYLHQQQAKHYALGAEQYIAMLLEIENSKDEKQQHTDHWFQPWAEEHVMPVEDGQVNMQVIDEQALINLNVLQGKNSTGKAQAFKEFLMSLHIDPQLADRIQKWGTQEPQKLLEQDSLYMSQVPPIRAGGGELKSVSELKLMQMMSREEYKKLRPFVTVLPKSVQMNINTVPAELFPFILLGISQEEAGEIIHARGQAGFDNLQAIRDHPALQNKKIDWNKLKVSFSSQFFSVYIKANYSDTTYYLHSRLARSDKGDVVVTSREEGEYPQWVSILRQSVRQQ